MVTEAVAKCSSEWSELVLSTSWRGEQRTFEILIALVLPRPEMTVFSSSESRSQSRCLHWPLHTITARDGTGRVANSPPPGEGNLDAARLC